MASRGNLRGNIHIVRCVQISTRAGRFGRIGRI